MKSLRPPLAVFLLLMGCSTQSPQYDIVIPNLLTDPVETPKWKGVTNGDLVEHIIDLRAVIARCNADRTAIRKLVGGTQDDSPKEQ